MIVRQSCGSISTTTPRRPSHPAVLEAMTHGAGRRLRQRVERARLRADGQGPPGPGAGARGGAHRRRAGRPRLDRRRHRGGQLRRARHRRGPRSRAAAPTWSPAPSSTKPCSTPASTWPAAGWTVTLVPPTSRRPHRPGGAPRRPLTAADGAGLGDARQQRNRHRAADCRAGPRSRTTLVQRSVCSGCPAHKVRRVPITRRLERTRLPTRPRRTAGWSRTSRTAYAVDVVGDDERLADERVECPQHVDLVGVRRRPRDARRGRSRRRTPTRCAAALAHRRSTSRTTSPPRGAASAGAPGPGVRSPQQPESVGESIPDLDGAHRGHPRRCQLDPQREPVEVSQISITASAVCGSLQPEAGADRSGSLDEQRDGVGGRRRPRAPAATPQTVSPAPRAPRATSPGPARSRPGRGSFHHGRAAAPRRARSCRPPATAAVRRAASATVSISGRLPAA